MSNGNSLLGLTPEPWFLYALGVFFVWGTWGFLHKISTMFVDPRSALVYESGGVIVVACLVLLSLNFHVRWHPVGSAFAFSSGLAGITGALCFLYAVTTGGKLIVVVTLTSLYPALTILLSFVFLREQISMTQGIGVVLALVAMILCAY